MDLWYIFLVILYAVGFIMGIYVLLKGPKRYPWALHLILTIFFAPIEIPFAALELQSLKNA